MIKDNKPLSMAEAVEYIEKTKDNGTDVAISFVKKFTKLKSKEAKELREKIRKLDLMKVKEEHITKIIDLMPENREDLNKIFIDTSLDEDEAKKILETIKECK